MLTQEQYNKLRPNLKELEKQRQVARYSYLGILSEYQLFVQIPNQQIVYTKLNPQQHFLFKRVLHGLKMYNYTEVEQMHWDKKEE